MNSNPLNASIRHAHLESGADSLLLSDGPQERGPARNHIKRLHGFQGAPTAATTATQRCRNRNVTPPFSSISATWRRARALAMTLLFLAVVAPVAARSAIGRIIAIEGAVEARGIDDTVRVLEMGAPVYAGDEIVTGAGAKAQIFLIDDTTISQGQESVMVIDEYVYDAQTGEGQGVLQFVRGVFRNITGRITEVNPDRFKIRTGKTVIGIRGCDLFFEVQPLEEIIYIVELPDGGAIEIEFTASRTRDARDLSITRAGRKILLMPDGRYRERTIRAQTLNRLINATTPAITPPAIRLRLGAIDTPPTTGFATDYAPAVPVLETAHSPARISDVMDRDTITKPKTEHVSVLPAPPPFARLPPSAQPTPTAMAPAPIAAPETPERLERSIASGMNWDWGFWEYSSFEPQGMYQRGQYLSDDAVRDLVAGSIERHLYGTGRAGALLTMPDASAHAMHGPVDFSIRFGADAAPGWSGAFSLSGKGSRLDFNATGSVGDGNRLHGESVAYYLIIGNTSHGLDTLTVNRVDGRLVGKHGTQPDVNGVVGGFEFQHGVNQPRVTGAYGADLFQGRQ